MNFPELKKIVNIKKCLCLSDFQDLTKMYYECEFEDSELDEWIDFGAFLFEEIAYINIFSKVFTVSSVAYRKHTKKPIFISFSNNYRGQTLYFLASIAISW